MTINITASEILDKGVDTWDSFCDDRGINPWVMNEGLMDSDEVFTFNEEEAQKYGFLNKMDLE